MLAGIAWTSAGPVEAYDFSMSQGRLGPTQLLDSSTSPPARYLMEIGRRILARSPTATVIAVANPLLPVNSEGLAGWLRDLPPGPAVLADEDRFPLAYVLPRQAFEDDARFLLVLSTVDAALDARLLTAVLDRDVVWRTRSSPRIGEYPVSTASGWFQGRERHKILKILAANAIRIIDGNPAWRTLPFAVYHPYHAGSIVFFAAAARAARRPLFQRHIICESYRDIVAACDHPMEPIWLKLPWLPRDNSIGEPQYFANALDSLGEEVTLSNFIVFMRYARSTGHSPFHRVEHDRFALGDSMEDSEQKAVPLPLRRCPDAAAPLKVLFHVTGGLPIKNYPADHARVALRTLAALGVETTVIGRPDLEPFGARSIKADETALLVAAVERHHIFVGLDSFPHHFVRNIMRWPTIGLFGTTTAANFGGGWDAHYRALDSALPCHPCGGESSCPLFGYKECANYVAPQTLVATILAMAADVYGYGAKP